MSSLSSLLLVVTLANRSSESGDDFGLYTGVAYLGLSSDSGVVILPLFDFIL